MSSISTCRALDRVNGFATLKLSNYRVDTTERVKMQDRLITNRTCLHDFRYFH